MREVSPERSVFANLRDEAPQGLIGYLRFVDEDGGRGVRGALFLGQ